MTNGGAATAEWTRACRRWPLSAIEGGPNRWWLIGGAALAAYFGPDWWRELGDFDVTINLVPDVVDALADQSNDEPAWAAEFRNWLQTGHLADESLRTFSVGATSGPSLSFRRVSLPAGQWSSTMHPDLVVDATEAILQAPDGTAVLAPELVLLGKSRQGRPKDLVDFTAGIRLLDAPRRERLLAYLPPDHPWRRLTA